MRNRNYSDNRSTKTRRKKNNKQRWATRLQNEGTIVCGCVYDGHRHLFISDRAPLYAYEANLQRHEKNSYIYFGSQDLYENEANINIRKILMMVHRITSNERPALRPERSGRRREKSAASRTFAYFFCCCFTLHNSEERRPAAAIPRCQLFHRKQKCASTRCNVDASQNVIY